LSYWTGAYNGSPPGFGRIRKAGRAGCQGFTHIYTARRVADHLLNGEFPDWPDTGGELDGYDAKTCGAIMQKWERFTHLGAIGPDMFYYCQDWNNDISARSATS
jgi:hypothetical protein